MPWYGYVMVALLMFASGGRVCLVGQERDPITPAEALTGLAVNALFVWGIISLGS